MGRKSRANPPICWLCDRKLHAAGYHYTIVKDEEGREHPAHVSCAKYQRPEVTARPTGGSR